MNYSFKTDIGQLRKTNEDSVLVSTNKYGQVLAIVADGMGGHNAGDIASKVTVNKIGREWSVTDEIKSGAAAKKWLSNEIRSVNQHILTYAEAEEVFSGMGTTVVGAIALSDKTIIANVGDSRAYALFKNDLIQITNDQTLVNELLEQEKITEEEAMFHPQKNVLLQAVGTNKVLKIDFFEVDNRFDYIILCSDGLTNLLSDDEIKDVILKNDNIDDTVNELIDTANNLGGHDNITVVILRVGE